MTKQRLLEDIGAVERILPRVYPGSAIAIICRDRYAFAASLLAAWQKGHAVALPPNGRPDTVEQIADDESIAALLHDTDQRSATDVRAVLGQSGGPVVVLDPIDAARHLATVYTSGSSDAIRAYPKTAGQLLAEAEELIATFHIEPGTAFTATVPPHHIYGLLFSVLVPLQCGGRFCRRTPLHAEAIAAQLSSGGALQALVSVPAHLTNLELLPASSLAGVQRVFSSGSALHLSSAEMLRSRHNLKVTEVLGSTETGGIAWRHQLEEPLWRPLPSVRVTADGARLIVDSPFVPLDARPFRTSDRVRLVGSDLFAHEGRSDRTVKVAGQRVDLDDLEQRIRQLDGVVDVAVTTVATEGRRDSEVLAALVAPGWTSASIRRELRRWFDTVVLPRRMRFERRLPREDNGKLTRARLLALFEPVVAEIPVLEHVVGESDSKVDHHHFRISIPPDLLAMKGHFPDQQLLPAVSQLHDIVLPRIADLRPTWPSSQRMTRLKFLQPIYPGDALELSVMLPSTGIGRADFLLARAGRPCCKGRVHYEADAR